MSDAQGSTPRPWRRISWWLLSRPIVVKILAVGAMVAVLLGALAILEAQGAVASSLYAMLEQRTVSLGHSLTHAIVRPLERGDGLAVKETLDHALETSGMMLYYVIQDHEGAVVVHSFTHRFPADLKRTTMGRVRPEGDVQVLDSSRGRILDGTFPIRGGQMGTLRIGVSAVAVRQQVMALTQSAVYGLGFCAAIGLALGFGFTRLMTEPLRELSQATRRVRDGDFDVRAPVLADDEIGQLATSFNEMASGLAQYRLEVKDKEKALARLLERFVIAQEQERKGIARELHDHLGQSLSALLLAIGQVEPGDGASWATAREAMRTRIRALIDDVRQLAWGIRPSILDDFGLVEALARHTQDIARHAKIEIDFEASAPDGSIRLPGHIEMMLYRIAQEAITNVVRHARATHASVVLVRRRQDVRLIVEDDGGGFDVASIRGRPEGCLGLTGIEERVALLGGTCTLESVPGKGTTVGVRVPFDEEGVCPSVS